MILLRTLIFTVLVPGTVTVFLPRMLYGNTTPADFGWLRYAALPFLLVGIVVYCWCALDFTFAGRGTPLPADPPKQLVVRGLYRYVRNPMYLGVGSVLLGETIWFQLQQMFVYDAIVFAFWHLFVVLYEEPTLERNFGESYRRYRDDVPRWLPRAFGFRSRSAAVR
jgi:protein-S-isoprenylcysteine O-methyltransferase Ste14